MTARYKRIRRTYYAICTQCLGSGFQATKHGCIKCSAPGCVRGDVERILNEIVHEEEDDGQRNKASAN